MENNVNNVAEDAAQTPKESSRVVRIALTVLLCATIFGSGVLRSYQAGVENQAARIMHEVNNPATLAAAQHQIQWAKNIVKK